MKINKRLCHPLQNAYQPQLCSFMTSFSLQETVQHFYERASKVFCCLLDVSSVFDTVYHYGLFVKLYESGIEGTFKLWIILFSAYGNMNMYEELCYAQWIDVKLVFFRAICETRRRIISMVLYIVC